MLAKKFTAAIALVLALTIGAPPTFSAANVITIQPYKCGDGVEVDITGGPTKFNTPTDRGFNFSNTLISVKIDESKGGKGGAIIETTGLIGNYLNDFQGFEVLVAKLNNDTWEGLGKELGFLFCVDYGKGQEGAVFFKANELERGLLGKYYTRVRLSKETLRKRLIQLGQAGMETDAINIERVVIVYNAGGVNSLRRPTQKHLLIGRIKFVNKVGVGYGQDYLQTIYPDQLLLPPIEDCDADESCYEER